MTGNNRYWYDLLGASGCSEGEVFERHSLRYTMRGGILRQHLSVTEGQEETGKNFAFKWKRRSTYESESVQKATGAWLEEKYLEGDRNRLAHWLPEGARVLDAGCGAGLSSILFLGDLLSRIAYLGVDISTAVDVAQARFKERGFPGEFIQGDITRLPFDGPAFDAIFSEGVLHHTDSTERSLKTLAEHLLPGGRFLFYIYARKGPLREFSDDLIREHLQGMSDEDAWEALRPLTRLGKVLGDLHVTVEVPADIPFLGIRAGSIDLQRLFYWHVCKAYYRPDWDLEEMNHVNFDWYRPPNCHRHDPEQVRRWCHEAGLRIEHMKVEPSGITVVAVKAGQRNDRAEPLLGT